MIAIFDDYEAFKAAHTTVARKADVFFTPAIAGVQDFSVAAAVDNTAIIMRYDSSEQPAGFLDDFPIAISVKQFYWG